MTNDNTGQARRATSRRAVRAVPPDHDGSEDAPRDTGAVTRVIPTWLVERPGALPEIVTTDPGADGVSVSTLPINGGRAFAHVITRIEDLQIAQTFGIGVVSMREDKFHPVVAPDGSAQRMLIKVATGMDKNGRPLPSSVVWHGTIDAVSMHRVFDIDHSRRLTNAEWSEFVRYRVTNRNGIVREGDVATMAFRGTQKEMSFIDMLGLATVSRTTDVIAYMRILSLTLPDNGIAIAGQGPVYLRDDSRAFVAQSGVFDEHGNDRPEIVVDASKLPHKFRYYDVLPANAIDPELVRQGIGEIARAYGEVPAHPEIPAAMLGTVFTASVATLDPNFFIATFLYGVPGSGKSRLSRRMDAMQAPGIKGYQDAKPVLNLASTGTVKGGQYRVSEYGGFAITVDDVCKSGDSTFQIDQSKTVVSNLIRSIENGGGALGKVNKAKNRVESGESGELHSNVRFTSERPIPGDSTLDRMIILPGLTETWDAGIFDCGVSESLWQTDSLISQQHATSALTRWLFTQIDTLDSYLIAARDITRQWTVAARTAERYTAVVASQLVFQTFAASHDIDVSDVVNTAVTALEGCAQRQSLSKLSPATLFRMRLTDALSDQYIFFTGRPIVNPHGEVIKPSPSPFLYEKHERPNVPGVFDTVVHMPPNVRALEQLGVRRSGSDIASPSGETFGYVVAPVGKNKTWQLLVTQAQMRRLADALTRYSRDKDHAVFTAEGIIETIVSAEAGVKGTRKRIYVTDDGTEWADNAGRRHVTVIDMAWLFEPLDDAEGQD